MSAVSFGEQSCPSRDVQASTWYVTAIGVDWVLGVATYYAVPTLGPVYARPEVFAGLDHTDVTGLQATMMWSPGFTEVTPVPTSRTMPAPS